MNCPFKNQYLIYAKLFMSKLLNGSGSVSYGDSEVALVRLW
jgi:hypothetical protein